MRSLFLASRSPRRRELLSAAGIPFTLVDADVDETLEPGVDPVDAVLHLAERKARAGARIAGRGLVLGADTLVALDDRILGKPRDREDAREMLTALSGACHRVITGICLVDAATGEARRDHAVTRVTMRDMSPEEIAEYVASGESDDKAGAYAIQERGDRFVTRLEGPWDNVVGLPVDLVLRHLEAVDG